MKFLIALCLLVLISACAAPFVGSMQVHASGDTLENPTVLARYDGDVFVGWAVGYAQAEVFAHGSSGSVYGPVNITSGYAVVHCKSLDLKWSEKIPTLLPACSRPLFRQSEIDAWGLAFDDGPML